MLDKSKVDDQIPKEFPYCLAWDPGSFSGLSHSSQVGGASFYPALTGCKIPNSRLKEDLKRITGDQEKVKILIGEIEFFTLELSTSYG